MQVGIDGRKPLSLLVVECLPLMFQLLAGCRDFVRLFVEPFQRLLQLRLRPLANRSQFRIDFRSPASQFGREIDFSLFSFSLFAIPLFPRRNPFDFFFRPLLASPLNLGFEVLHPFPQVQFGLLQSSGGSIDDRLTLSFQFLALFAELLLLHFQCASIVFERRPDGFLLKSSLTGTQLKRVTRGFELPAIHFQPLLSLLESHSLRMQLRAVAGKLLFLLSNALLGFSDCLLVAFQRATFVVQPLAKSIDCLRFFVHSTSINLKLLPILFHLQDFVLRLPTQCFQFFAFDAARVLVFTTLVVQMISSDCQLVLFVFRLTLFRFELFPSRFNITLRGLQVLAGSRQLRFDLLEFPQSLIMVPKLFATDLFQTLQLLPSFQPLLHQLVHLPSHLVLKRLALDSKSPTFFVELVFRLLMLRDVRLAPSVLWNLVVPKCGIRKRNVVIKPLRVSRARFVQHKIRLQQFRQACRVPSKRGLVEGCRIDGKLNLRCLVPQLHSANRFSGSRIQRRLVGIGWIEDPQIGTGFEAGLRKWLVVNACGLGHQRLLLLAGGR